MAFTGADRSEYGDAIRRYSTGVTKQILESPPIDCPTGKGPKKLIEEFNKKNNVGQRGGRGGQNGWTGRQNDWNQNGQGQNNFYNRGNQRGGGRGYGRGGHQGGRGGYQNWNNGQKWGNGQNWQGLY